MHRIPAAPSRSIWPAKASPSNEMVVSGMLIGGEDIAEPYDRFRNRVMFPIADLKGKIIAFGGRALEKDVPAKYLNSPETPLFHKGAILFNAAQARPLAHDRERLIVVEGYMDVVTLAEAGFGESVAPLGTALTEDQIKLLWRMVPEPTLCFDGDSAGKKAAHRAIDVILPNLTPGTSANIAFLPDGLDPDDLIRQSGPEAMQDVLARARPLADVLWEREFASGDWSTPERRARLEQQIGRLVNLIADQGVRSHYAAAMRDKLRAAWGTSSPAHRQDGRSYGDGQGRTPGYQQGHGQGGRNGGKGAQGASKGWQRHGGGGQGGQWGRFPPPRAVASHSLRQSGLVDSEGFRPPYREALLLGAILNHPWLLEAEAEAIAQIEFTSTAMARLRDQLLALLSDNISLDRGEVRTQLERLSLTKVVDLVGRAITHRSDRFAEPDANPAEVETGWRHTLALHERQTGLQQALDAAERAWNEEGSEDALARIVELKRQLASTNDVEFPADA